MRHNVLVLGCSHLSGAYDKKDNITGPESYAWHLRKMYGNKDRYVTFPNPSQGILKYASIIEHMDKNDLLKDFTHCIVQLTHEPRNVFMNDNESLFYAAIENSVHSDQDFVNGYKIQSHPSFAEVSSVERYLFDKHEKSFVKKMKWGLFGMFYSTVDFRDEFMTVSKSITSSLETSRSANAIFPISYSYILTTLNKYNIRVASFDWWGKSEDHQRSMDNIFGDEYIFPKYKSVMNLQSEKFLWDKDKQSNLGHLNAKQSRQVAETLKEHLDNVEFFD